MAIELLMPEGFTPIEVIRIATYNGANALGKQDKIGSIESRKIADLIVIDGKISQEIKKGTRAMCVQRRSGIRFQKIICPGQGAGRQILS
jgi:imidazolonepropionase-like amidohydrolase